MPTRLDAEALHKAAATLPPAIEVNATEACTVEGRVHRNIRPSTICGANRAEASDRSARPASGNRTKLAAKITRCSRQCEAPATMAARDSRAPCEKNNSPIAAEVRAAKSWAPAPWQGNTNAIVTVAAIARVNSSGRKRASIFIGAVCEAKSLPEQK